MMSKVLVTIFLSFFVCFAVAKVVNKKVPEVSVSLINCEMNEVVIGFAVPEFGSCKGETPVELKPGETFNCKFTPKEVRPHTIQAYAPTGVLTMMPILYHGFCIGVAKASFGYQYVPCDPLCLKTATEYEIPYKNLMR